MVETGLDVLVAQGSNDFMGGHVKYLTDIPATSGYPLSVVPPRDEDMTNVRMGPFNGVKEIGPGDPVLRGIRCALTTPSFASASYTRQYDSAIKRSPI